MVVELLIIIFVIFLLPVTLPLVTVLIEKRKSWPYSDRYEFEPFELSKFHRRFMEEAKTAALEYGFTYLERGFDNKGKSYRVVYDFLISQDGYTLALLGAGKVLSFGVQGVWLFSYTADGHTFETITSQAADEYDSSGMSEHNLILTNDFKKAFRSHINKMNSHDRRFEAFSESPLDDLRMLCLKRLEVMEAKGLVRFLDPGRDRWKYTLKGGLIFAFCGVYGGMLKLPASLWKGFVDK